jgi:hypothetical protein
MKRRMTIGSFPGPQVTAAQQAGRIRRLCRQSKQAAGLPETVFGAQEGGQEFPAHSRSVGNVDENFRDDFQQ